MRTAAQTRSLSECCSCLVQALKVGGTAGMQLLLQQWETQPHLGQGACARLLLRLCRCQLLRCGDGGLLLLLVLLKGRLRPQRGGRHCCHSIGRLHSRQKHASREQSGTS